MRSLQGLFLLLFFWAIVAPACMTFRKADVEMIKAFKGNGVELRTQTEKVEGRNLHFAITGADSLPTLFFVHGTPGSWDAFAGYLQDSALLQHYRLVAIDRPGFGYSDFGRPEHLNRQSELIGPLFDKIANGKPFYLVGHSLGGPMIIKLAADYPNRVNGLVIISGSIDPNEEKPERWRPWLSNTPFSLLIPGALKPSNTELWYLKKDLVDLKKDFPRVAVPVFFIHGKKDGWVPSENVEYGKKMLVNAPAIGMHIFPEGNHFIPWTRYSQIRDILLNLQSLMAENAALSRK